VEAQATVKALAAIAVAIAALAPPIAIAAGSAGGGAGGVAAQQIGRFKKPVYVHGPPGGDGALFVVERAGRVKVMPAEGGERTFLDIKRRVSCCTGERGLFSVAFAPDYEASGRFYVYFTDRKGDIRVDEYQRSPDDPLRASSATRRKVLRIRHRRFSNHNGGQLQFGPDGYLYAGTGDGGGAADPRENAQSKRSLLGKLLRIDPLRQGGGHRVPSSNPYADKKGKDEIYARGLRNPWRFSFDGDHLVIADVGQDRFEEIDYETVDGARGANFGWDAFEGSARFRSPDASNPPKRHERPIAQYGHGGANCSITGGYVVRDPELPSLQGRYVYGDLCGGEIRSLIPELGGARDDRPVGLREPGLVSFGEDAADRVYFASAATGRVFRIVPRAAGGE
jgi:glucose/arabinose dehydrogenase